jgi:hypothetical protein
MITISASKRRGLTTPSAEKQLFVRCFLLLEGWPAIRVDSSTLTLIKTEILCYKCKRNQKESAEKPKLGIGMTLFYHQSLTPPVHPASMVIRSSSFLDDFLLKNPMNLTDEQWRLIEPILPPPSPSDRGRPPLDRRAVLNGILWKFRTDYPWYDMPPDYPPTRPATAVTANGPATE